MNAASWPAADGTGGVAALALVALLLGAGRDDAAVVPPAGAGAVA
jgi:hypothetical protein